MSDGCITAADAASIPAGATDKSEGHTPGPWEVFETPHVMPASEVLGTPFPEHHWSEYGVRTAWVHGQAKGKVAVVGIGSSRDGPILWLREEDARLIAAAPDLLEAAQRVLAANDRIVDAMMGALDPADAKRIAERRSAEFTKTLAPLRAAIAKATTGLSDSLGGDEGREAAGVNPRPVSPAEQVGEDRWADLERLAQEATAGPWYQLKNHDSVWTADGEVAVADTGASKRLSLGKEIDNAAFIAAANPATVQELIAAARASAVGIGAADEPKAVPTGDAEGAVVAPYDDVVLRSDRDGKLQVYSSRFNSIVMTFERSMPERQRREFFARLVAAPAAPATPAGSE